MLSGFIEAKHPVPGPDQSAGMAAAANLSSFYPFLLFSLNLLKHKLLVSHAFLLHSWLNVPA